VIAFDLVDFVVSPYFVSFLAIFLAICNFVYVWLKDKPKIKITFQNFMVLRGQPKKPASAICINIANIRGGPTTIFFPDILLPDKRSGGNKLYLKSTFTDPRKRTLTPNLSAGARSGWPTYFTDRGQVGNTPPFPYELGRGKLSEVWIENAELAAKLKELRYESGEVKLKINVPNTTGRPYLSKKITFDVDNAKMLM